MGDHGGENSQVSMAEDRAARSQGRSPVFSGESCSAPSCAVRAGPGERTRGDNALCPCRAFKARSERIRLILSDVVPS